MAKFHEEHGYLIALVILTFAEGLLAIPFFIPLFDTSLAELYLLIGMLHILCLALLATKMVEVRPYGFHILGSIGLFLSVIPYINAIFHGVVCFLGLRACRSCITYLKQLKQQKGEA